MCSPCSFFFCERYEDLILKKMLFVFTFFCIFLFVKVDSHAAGVVDGSDGVTDGSTGNVIGDIVEDVTDGTDDDSGTSEPQIGEISKEKTEKDEKGHIVNGYTYHKSASTSNGYYYITVTKILTPEGAFCYFLHCSNSYYKLVSVNDESSYTYVMDRYKNDEYLSTSTGSGSISVDGISAGYWMDEEYFYTNIPIFDENDVEGIEKYVNDADYSDAENAEEVDKEVAESDESIEAPQGLKVSGGYATGLSSAYHFAHDFVANWSQTVDTTDYVYDVQAQCTISLVSKSGSTVLTGESYSSDWVDYGTKNYSGSTSITHSISKDNLNDKLLESALANAMDKSGKKLTYKGYLISKLKVRVRNRIDGKCSDWYVATVDYDSSSTTGTVEDDDENVIEDDGDIADSNDDSTTGESIESNIAAILNYIRSGFGLLGDTGIISLMSQCFLYLPASIWIMLKFLIAMTVTMSVIGLIKKFVF